MAHSAEFVIIEVYGPNEDPTDGEKDDFYVHIQMSQEECEILRESVP